MHCHSHLDRVVLIILFVLCIKYYKLWNVSVKVSGSCSLRSPSSLVLHLSCTVLRGNLIVGCLGQVKVDGSITAAVKLYFIIFCDGNTLSVKSQYVQSSKKIDNCFQQFSNSYALKDEYTTIYQVMIHNIQLLL